MLISDEIKMIYSRMRDGITVPIAVTPSCI